MTLTSTISWLLAVIVTASGILCAQGVQDQDLARRLANDVTQQAAITEVTTSGDKKIPLLLSWTGKPPIPLGELELYIFEGGLADVFGQLKTKKAIPFLIKNINLHRWPDVAPVWMKAPEVIEERMPAIKALIRIGPDALKTLVNETPGPLSSEDRLARVFVVARIASALGQSESARQYLISALGEANAERFWAEEGLKWLDTRGK